MTRDPHPSPSSAAAPASGAAAFLLGDRALTPPGRPLVMGILNATPDSFHAASRVDARAAADLARAMADAGAELLDVGAESTRPGSAPVDAEAELRRLLPVVEAVRRVCDLPLTVDTRRAAVARAALDAGADGINDVSAGRDDPELLPLAAARGAGLVLMHMQGTPATMQTAPAYADPVAEVRAFLAGRATAAEAAGVDPRRILVDPGIGFGKTLEHNLALLRGLARAAGGRPCLLGASRKSFIGRLTGAETPDRLGGSLAAAAAALDAGAAVVRVHDVAATRQFLDVLAAIRR